MGNRSGKSRRLEALERENAQQKEKIVALENYMHNTQQQQVKMEKSVKDLGKDVKKVKEQSDNMAGQLKNMEVHGNSNQPNTMELNRTKDSESIKITDYSKGALGMTSYMGGPNRFAQASNGNGGPSVLRGLGCGTPLAL